MSGGGADIRPVEYLADLYLHSGRNIARVTAPGRLLSFHGGHAIVRDPGDILWALQQSDLTIQPTARYWELLPQWIRALKDPKQGGREAFEVEASIALPEGWHVGLPPDYALYHDRDALPTPYGWEPDPPPPPSSPEAHCATCNALLTPGHLKAQKRYCSRLCRSAAEQSEPASPPLGPQACAWCGEQFTPYYRKAKTGEAYLTRYCGTKCAARAQGNAKRVNAAHADETWIAQQQRRSTAAPAQCARCGGTFIPYRSRGGYTRYCSRTCVSAMNMAKIHAERTESRGVDKLLQGLAESAAASRAAGLDQTMRDVVHTPQESS